MSSIIDPGEASFDDPLVERSRSLAAALGGFEDLGESLFTPRFLRKVDLREVSAILARLYADHGPVEGLEIVGPIKPGAWILRWYFANGSQQLHQIAVESSPPHRIGSLLIGPPWRPDEVDPTEPTSTTFIFPFSGTWHVTWGGRTLEENYHRSTTAQRYAYDFSVVREGSYCRGEGDRNEDHYCFGREILAPAQGRVVWAVDGVADNEPGQKNNVDPLGNFVVLEHRGDEFSFLAHLKEGSTLVREGDQVDQGQKIGECGNSGRSTKPHLHFHVQDSPDLTAGVGLPPRFGGNPEPRRGEEVGNPSRCSEGG